LRLVRRPLGWSLTPADVLRLVRPDPHPVALCGAWTGDGDVIAAAPVAVRAAPGPLAEVLDGDLGDLDGDDRGQAFGGGWIGYLGYSAAGEALPPAGPRALPAWWFGYYDQVLHRDRATGEWHFEALWTQERADALEKRFDELNRRAAFVLAGMGPAGTGDADTGPANTGPANTGPALPFTGSSVMSTAEQAGTAWPQRGTKGQPGSGSRRSGGEPGMPARSRRGPRSDGKELSRPLV
jgi:hypothetical protein